MTNALCEERDIIFCMGKWETIIEHVNWARLLSWHSHGTAKIQKSEVNNLNSRDCDNAVPWDVWWTGPGGPARTSQLIRRITHWKSRYHDKMAAPRLSNDKMAAPPPQQCNYQSPVFRLELDDMERWYGADPTSATSGRHRTNAQAAVVSGGDQGDCSCGVAWPQGWDCHGYTQGEMGERTEWADK